MAEGLRDGGGGSDQDGGGSGITGHVMVDGQNGSEQASGLHGEAATSRGLGSDDTKPARPMETAEEKIDQK